MTSTRVPIALFFFALLVAYSNWFVEPGNTPRWILASAVVPVLFFFASAPVTKAHKIGLAFLGWMAVTGFVSASPWLAADRMWKFVLAGAVFCIASGLTRKEYHLCIAAVALGVMVNGAVALLCWLEWVPILHADEMWFKPGIFGASLGVTPGLMVNKNYLAAATVLAVVPLFVLGRFRGALATILTAPILLLAFSKSAAMGFLCATGGLVWRYSRKLVVLVLAIGVAGAVFYLHDLGADGNGNTWLMHQKVQSRAIIYANTMAGITIFGHGAGSYWTDYPRYANSWLDATPTEYSFEKRPRTAHNDFLTVAFEGGLVGLALYLWLIAAVLRRNLLTREDLAAWLTVIAYLGLSLTHFPGFLPHSLFVGMLHAGYLASKPS